MILDEIAAKTMERIEVEKSRLPLAELKAQVSELDRNTEFPFEKALAKKGMSFICEVKKASPSKGVIAEDFPYVEIGREYEKAGADAMSILTEPFYFQGSNGYLTAIRREVSFLPCSFLSMCRLRGNWGYQRWWRHMTRRRSGWHCRQGRKSSGSIIAT